MVNPVETAPRITVTVILYEGFEILDAFGPVELFGHVPGWTVEFAGVSANRLVRSVQGAQVQTDVSFTDLLDRQGGIDVVMVPGGFGNRTLVHDSGFLDDIAAICQRASVITSVCTGAAVLAAARVLDGQRATSNKKAWAWVTSQREQVDWVPQARWVVDHASGRPVWTSSGVAAGMDMAHALIAALAGASIADEIADNIELEVHRDPAWDPFAAVHGTL